MMLVTLTLAERYCTLLDCESFIHALFLSFFVIHVWHPRFPLNGKKKYWSMCGMTEGSELHPSPWTCSFSSKPLFECAGRIMTSFCLCPGEPMVRAGGLHSQHGDIWSRRSRQTGQQQRDPQTPLLQTGRQQVAAEASQISSELGR